jgi:class 3 adenylate cyclase
VQSLYSTARYGVPVNRSPARVQVSVVVNCVAVHPLPMGTVTFLMSDAEASSALWQRDAIAADAAFAHLAEVVENSVGGSGGVLLKARGEGDSHFAVFPRASSAVAAAVNLQRALAATDWRAPASIAVRVGIHTGEPLMRDGDYFGTVVNEAARLRGLGHGGQILLSSAAAVLARPSVGDEVKLVSLGVFRIRDFPQPQEVFQVVAPGLQASFRPLQALDTMPPPIAAVLCLDVSGSSRVLTTSDYQDVVKSAQWFASLARKRFDECGGYALHIHGDTVSAAFPTPTTAVRYVWELESRLRRRGFTIHAGMHAGELEVTSRGPAGLAAVVAAALQNVAQPGEIVVTGTIAELLRSADVVCEPRDRTPLVLFGLAWDLYRIGASSAADQDGL